MYVIKYDRDIYAGTYSDMDGCYLYPSCDINMQKPKIFKTLKGAEKHLSNLKNKVVYGKNADVYNFKIIEWSENDLESHLMLLELNLVKMMIHKTVILFHQIKS